LIEELAARPLRHELPDPESTAHHAASA